MNKENKERELKEEENNHKHKENVMKYIPNTKVELEKLVNDLSINLGDIDTSKITDMSWLFHNTPRTDFSGIEKWDVSNVTNMDSMFARAISFNQDISKWNVSNVRDMSFMFFGAESFNADISKWDVSSIEYIDDATKDLIYNGCNNTRRM